MLYTLFNAPFNSFNSGDSIPIYFYWPPSAKGKLPPNPPGLHRDQGIGERASQHGTWHVLNGLYR